MQFLKYIVLCAEVSSRVSVNGNDASYNGDAGSWFMSSIRNKFDRSSVSMKPVNTNMFGISRGRQKRPVKDKCNTYKTDSRAKWDNSETLYWSFDWNTAPKSFKDSARKYVADKILDDDKDRRAVVWRLSLANQFRSNPSPAEVDERLAELTMYKLIQHLFCVWSQHSDLKIKQFPVQEQKSHAVQLMQISFQSNGHSLGHNDHGFDGDGGVLAHAFPPPLENPTEIMRSPSHSAEEHLIGDIHLDSSEDWSMDFNAEKFFGYALLHEIGHSLGLQHDNNQWSIMYGRFMSQATRTRRGPTSSTIGSVYKSDTAKLRSLYGHRQKKLDLGTCEAGLLIKQGEKSVEPIRKGESKGGIIAAIIRLIKKILGVK